VFVPHSVHRVLAAAAAILLLAAASGTALAVDEPVLHGIVIGADGNPFTVEEARLTLSAPDDGGVIATKFEIADDGSFEVPLMPWGTTTAPAEVRLTVTGVVTTVVLADDGCSQQFAPVAESTFPVALAGGAQPAPVQLVAHERLVETVCGGLATPAITLPPTDGFGASGSGPMTTAQASYAASVGALTLLTVAIQVDAGLELAALGIR
jgi:hypothetical protein